MHTPSRWLITLCAALCAVVFSQAANAQASLDFDGDGRSDFLATYLNGTALHWKSISSSPGGTIVDQDFGLAANIAAPANWLTLNSPLLLAIKIGPKNLVWRLQDAANNIREKNFGIPNDYTINGGDFDGDGYADAAIMRVKGKRYLWQIKNNFFANETPMLEKFYFGAIGERIFFLSPDGSYDWPAIIKLNPSKKSSRVIIKNPLSGVRRTLNHFPAALAKPPRPRPFPIRAPQGEDVLGVVTENSSNTILSIYALNGRRSARYKINGLAKYSVGEYDEADAGEEIVFASNTEATLINPFSGNTLSVTVPASSLQGSFQVIQALAATPTPTSTPTPVATSTPTVTPTPAN